MPINTATTLEIARRFNVVTMLLDRNLERGRGGRTALYHAGGTVTYAELFKLVCRTGLLLRSLGVEPENRVLIAGDNTVPAVATWLAAIRIGAVPVAVNLFGGVDDLNYYLRDTAATVAAVEPPLSTHAAQWLEQFPRLKAVVSLGNAEPPSVPFSRGAEFPDDLPPFDTGADDPAFWIYSSGSTGEPKGCVHLHHDLVYHIESGAGAVIPCTPEDVCYSPAKLFFGIGLGECIWRPLSYGAASVLSAGRTTPVGFMETIERFGVTEAFSIPTLYSHILASDQRAYNVSSVRRWIAGGESLPPAVSLAWEQRFGLPIDVAFGSNDNGFICFMSSPGARRPGSSGVLLPGFSARLLGEEGTEVGPGQVGELYLQHDAFAAGYWGKHAATKRTFHGEWFRTSDMFYVDSDGYFYFCGRNDDMFKVSGQWVSPVEVEAAIKLHPAVLEAAVMGETDRSGLTHVRAYLLLTPGTAPAELARELFTALRKELPGYKVPETYVVKDQFPRTGTGKVNRRALSAAPGDVVITPCRE